jgi:hypothetical protein
VVDVVVMFGTSGVTAMRGADAMHEGLFIVAKLDDFVPTDHPLLAVRLLVNEALTQVNARFNEINASRPGAGNDPGAPGGLRWNAAKWPTPLICDVLSRALPLSP